ncbi:iron ABC transporter permease [Actinomadura sp. KC216]|uniref:ABC transporter permease n=1 Tax=Actinomadura sp. KC216 TaxID=2530370 RepID=UPI001049F25A|nr:iron ABC transporter permease [Actinomadura sp. KC216]TDB87924.1 iron ABC transporter permease [Actinomadura sp. KC216]
MSTTISRADRELGPGGPPRRSAPARLAARVATWPVLVQAGCLGFLALFLFVPLTTVLTRSVVDDGEFTTEALRALFSGYYVRPIVNTLVVASLVTVLSLLISAPLAFLLACTDIRPRRTLTALMLVPYALPAPFLAMVWVNLFISNGVLEQLVGTSFGVPVYGMGALVVVQSFHLFPLAVTALATAWAGLGADLPGAARVHGASARREFRSVSLPLVRPALVNAALLVFAASVAEFGTPLLLAGPVGYRVLTTEIYSQLTVFPINVALASAMALVLCCVTYTTLIGARRMLRDRNFVTVRAGALAARRFVALGRARTPVSVLAGGVLLALIALPLATGVLIALTDVWGRGLGPDNWTAHHFADVLWKSDRTRHAIVNVVVLGALAGFCAAALGFLCAHLAIRRGGRSGRLIDTLVFVPYVVPGVVLAIGLVLTFRRDSLLPLVATYTILLLAYVLRFLPVAYRTENAALAQVDERFEHASRVFGASWPRATFGIGARLTTAALAGAWVLVFVSVLKEVSASTLLWSPGHEVAPVLAIVLFRDGEVQQGVALNLVLAVVAIILTLVMQGFGGRDKTRRTK